jgi:hypothetical protein
MREELQQQIELARHNLALAEGAGLSHEADLHRARLEDLLDRAALHGIDATGWVDGARPVPPATAEG